MKDLELCLEKIKEHTAKNNIVGKWSDFLVEKKFNKLLFETAKTEAERVYYKDFKKLEKEFNDNKINQNKFIYETFNLWWFCDTNNILLKDYVEYEYIINSFKKLLESDCNQQKLLINNINNKGFNILIEFAEYLHDNDFKNLLIELKEKFDNNSK
ncbi:hypothetical protein OFO07_03600 [Campylobacter sp. JMF_06 NA1]|uniref:hypothetical protein n=1 Tax=Campylobacter sp. JMF_06 NA1 TaxID=2983823 RepID=UPI0022EA0C62|nr:hypothetical protein [Campylobacter sp. JMF_06 NA1]MDA3078010.1 hypothetical protein [Campylobacter sp. JMF_06 NA1]